MVGFVTPILCGCPNLILITLLKVVTSFIMMIIDITLCIRELQFMVLKFCLIPLNVWKYKILNQIYNPQYRVPFIFCKKISSFQRPNSQKSVYEENFWAKMAQVNFTRPQVGTVSILGQWLKFHKHKIKGCLQQKMIMLQGIGQGLARENV